MIETISEIIINQWTKVLLDNDLIPVYPNCHAMLHCLDPPLTIEKLKRLLLP